MIKNRLFSSGQVVPLATGQTYTLKDAEVMINGVVYRKSDIETTLQGNADKRITSPRNLVYTIGKERFGI